MQMNCLLTVILIKCFCSLILVQIGKIFFSLKSTTIPSKNRGEFQFFLVKVQDDFGVDLVHPPDISPPLSPQPRKI